MRFLSLFSGIEAASVAFEPIGGVPVAFSEIEPFPCAVLAHHYPNVPNLGDVTKITEGQIASLGPIDLVCFGSPCQDLSVAGKRKGLVDAATGDVTRSGLFFAAMRIFKWANKHCGARFALWENVAGAYSSNKGEDFAAVVAEMAGLENVRTPENGWGSEGCAVGDNGMLEWACMDAQWFGVAQRRRRVFAVLDTGDWANRPPLLLEPDSLRRDSPPSREAGEGTTGGSGSGASGGTWWDGGQISQTLDAVLAKGQTMPEKNRFPAVLQPVGVFYAGQGAKAGSIAYSNEVSPTLKAGDSGTNRAPTIHTHIVHGTQDPCVSEHTAFALGRNNGGENAIATFQQSSMKGKGTIGYDESGIAKPVKTQMDGQMIHAAMSVRRLLPEECEKLQGFLPGYTMIPWRNKPADQCPDGPRYKALGNSWAVPNVQWIGKRIAKELA